MKKVILLAMTILAAQTSFANETIVRGYPTASVGGNLITVDALCLEANEVRTINTHVRCVENDEEGRCVRSVKEIYRAPLAASQEVCKEWAIDGDSYICIKKAKEVYSFAQTYNVPVFSVEGDGVFILIDSFAFNIPACK